MADEWEWETVTAKGEPTARHEATFVAHKNQLYLIGGRRINPVDVYNPENNTWVAWSKTPLELHHFQAVVVEDALYLMGAMTGKYPYEKPLEKVIVYYPERDEFEYKHAIPKERQRGGAGAVLYKGKIYLIGGITNGHYNGYQPWFDEYDPQTGAWRALPDAPRARDHFQAVVIEDKLYVCAGRTTSKETDQVFELTVGASDVYDFETGKWATFDHIPTERAGNMAIAWGNEVVVGGGESQSQKMAHNQVEAYDLVKRVWRAWPSLNRGRHGTGFAIVGNYLYTASGCGNRGGNPELTSLERLRLPDVAHK